MEVKQKKDVLEANFDYFQTLCSTEAGGSLNASPGLQFAFWVAENEQRLGCG